MLIDPDLKIFLQAIIRQKTLGIGKQKKTYAVCPKCNTLYNASDILTQNVTDHSNRGFKCIHVEFSNHPRHNKRQACEIELTNKVLVVTVVTS